MKTTDDNGQERNLVKRFGLGPRASLATVLGGTGYFAVTPQAPYDGRLSTADQTRQLLAKAETRLAEMSLSEHRRAVTSHAQRSRHRSRGLWDHAHIGAPEGALAL